MKHLKKISVSFVTMSLFLGFSMTAYCDSISAPSIYGQVSRDIKYVNQEQNEAPSLYNQISRDIKYVDLNKVYATNTPFDNFEGRYKVVNRDCVDFLGTQGGYYENIIEISITKSSVKNEVLIDSITDLGENHLIYSQSLGSSFSGDGVNVANWKQHLKSDKFELLNSITFSIQDNITTYTHEGKIIDQRGINPYHLDAHLRCQFELIKL